MKRQVLCDLFKFTPKTLYNWRQESRPAIEFIEKYFSEEDIQEFLQTNKMKKLENIERYAQYEKRIMDEIRNIVTSENRDFDPLYVYQFIEVIGEKYSSLKEKYKEAQEKENFTASSYCAPDDYDFTDILVAEFDELGGLIRLKMTPITLEEFIKKNIFNLENIDTFCISPLFSESMHYKQKTTFYLQEAILGLYKNKLLSFVLAHVETFIEESIQS